MNEAARSAPSSPKLVPGESRMLALLTRARPAHILLALFAGSLVLFLVLIPASRGDGLLIGSDGIGYFIHVRSVVIDHDLDFANETEHYRSVYQIVEPWHGERTPNRYASVGMLVLWLPFYLAAHAIASLLHAMGAKVAADGYNYIYQAAVCLGSIFYGGLGMLLSYRMARRYYPEHPSAWALVVLWLASPLCYYMVFEPSMSHMNSFFAVSATLALWLFRLRDAALPRWRDFAALGALGAITMSVRMQDALFLAIPYAWIAWRMAVLGREGEGAAAWRWMRGALLAVLVTAALFSLQLYTWHVIYGTYLESPYQHDNGLPIVFFWAQPELARVLFSTQHGLFSWHPVLLLATVGVALHLRRDRWFAAAALAGIAAQIYVVAAWWAWWQGAAFGGRMFLNCGALWAVGMAAILAAVWHKPRWLPVAVAASCMLIAWNALALMQYRLGFVATESPLTWKEMTIDRLTLPLQILQRVRTGIPYAPDEHAAPLTVHQ